MASVPLPLLEDDIDLEGMPPADPVEALSPLDKSYRLAGSQGNIVDILDEDERTKLGNTVVDEYDKDEGDRSDWCEIVEEALDSAAQDTKVEAKTTPWPNASNINIPLLTTASLQFNARMYPAVVKGDEAVLCKVVGQDNGRPKLAPNPQTGEMQPLPQMQPPGPPDPQTGQPSPPQPMLDGNGMMVPVWDVPPGAKAKRARRVSEYLNHVVFYQMVGWEYDTDALLMQLPTVGCVFRKVWFDKYRKVQSMMVPALNLVVPKATRDLATTPRITEKLIDTYPHEIKKKMNAGFYREVDLGIDEDNDDSGARLLLEQHRWMDFDEDGVEEPYIVTVDHETREVLRLEAAFALEDIQADENGDVYCVERRVMYVKYGMFPNPKGYFYDIGLGHLLKKLGATIDTALNQLMDAGTAQTAGGGFIGAGVRLQGRGNRGVIRLNPGEYKVVDVSGDALRSGIYERTLPNVSPVTFQVLDFILGFAREISGVKDVLTGEANNTAPVGSTLALIEQGLQVFNATAKRFFLSAKNEYQMIADNLRLYGGAEAAANYQEVLDDPEANFEADFAAKDMDIRPVSDPASVTRMQKMARASYIQSTIPLLAEFGGDPREALRRSYEAADIEDIDKLLPAPKGPPPPDPKLEAMKDAEIAVKQADAAKKGAEAQKTAAETKMLPVQAGKLSAEAVKTQQEAEAMPYLVAAEARKTEVETNAKDIEAAVKAIGGQKEKYALEKEATFDGLTQGLGEI
jgi:chaperonin GroES